jgi:hypothetical protein
MLRRLAPAAVLLSVAAAPLRAQLGLITVPRGSLRIDLVGAFYPNDQDYYNGGKRAIGSLIDNGPVTPAIAALQLGLSSVLGQPVSGLSLGGVTAYASRDHGVGDIGFAFGINSRLTLFGNLPIVYVRSHITTTFDPSTSKVGINPANKKLGNGAGQSQQFINQFDVAIDTLRFHVTAGDYTGDKATQAQAALTAATAMRKALNSLLLDPQLASAVLPVASDPAAVQVLAKVTALETTINTLINNATPFNLLPEFPTATLTSDDFDKLLEEPTGIGLKSPNNLPHYGIGDMSAGLAYQLIQHGTPGRGSWTAAWLRLTGHFPNGTQPDPGTLLDQGTGPRDKAIQLDGIMEVAHHGIGVRGEVTYMHHLPANAQTRPTAPDELLVPPAYLVAVTTQYGDSMAIAARPWISFAPHLALSGVVQYWRRGASTTGLLKGQQALPGVDPTLVDIGSAANAFVAGIGLSYFHDGRSRSGEVSLPLEAGWSIERTVTSNAGIFPDNLTSRVYIKIYRRLIKH